jgi:hypothetical protein
MEYEGRGKNLKKSDVGCSLKKNGMKKNRPLSGPASHIT